MGTISKINPLITYLISTDEDVPGQYASDIQKVTLYNVAKLVRFTSDYCYPEFKLQDSQLMQSCGFTERQLMMLLMIKCGDVDKYTRWINAVADYKNVYLVRVKQRYLDENPDLVEFIQRAEIIEEKEEKVI